MKGDKTPGRRGSEPRFRSEKERAQKKGAAFEDEEVSGMAVTECC